jgi:AcrR family transcriptional regulator
MPARTAKTPLSRERILTAATAVADAEGLAAVTMRRVAEALDCEAMSLYYYVKDKSQLLSGLVEVVIDQIIAETMAGADQSGPQELSQSGSNPSTADWREVVRSRCLGARRVMLRHTWAPSLVAGTAVVPPNTYLVFEALVGTMIEAGFSYETAHRAIHSLGSMLMGFTQEIFEPDAAEDGTTAEEMAAMAAYFPHLGALASSVTHDQTDSLGVCDTQSEFEFTLNLVLNGLDGFRRNE